MDVLGDPGTMTLECSLHWPAEVEAEVDGVKVKATQGTVAVHSFSHSSVLWTIKTFMWDVFPFSFVHFLPVSML